MAGLEKDFVEGIRGMEIKLRTDIFELAGLKARAWIMRAMAEEGESVDAKAEAAKFEAEVSDTLEKTLNWLYEVLCMKEDGVVERKDELKESWKKEAAARIHQEQQAEGLGRLDAPRLTAVHGQFETPTLTHSSSSNIDPA